MFSTRFAGGNDNEKCGAFQAQQVRARQTDVRWLPPHLKKGDKTRRAELPLGRSGFRGYTAQFQF